MTPANCRRQTPRRTRALAIHETNRLNVEALQNPLYEWPATRQYCRVGSRLLKGQMLEQWQKTFPERPDRPEVL